MPTFQHLDQGLFFISIHIQIQWARRPCWLPSANSRAAYTYCRSTITDLQQIQKELQLQYASNPLRGPSFIATVCGRIPFILCYLTYRAHPIARRGEQALPDQVEPRYSCLARAMFWFSPGIPRCIWRPECSWSLLPVCKLCVDGTERNIRSSRGSIFISRFLQRFYFWMSYQSISSWLLFKGRDSTVCYLLLYIFQRNQASLSCRTPENLVRDYIFSFERMGKLCWLIDSVSVLRLRLPATYSSFLFRPARREKQINLGDMAPNIYKIQCR